MEYLRTLLTRVRTWWMQVTHRTLAATFDPSLVITLGPPIYRDVTPSGVRVYSVCGGCGARLECSATLCEECAQGPHTSAF